jgi:WhiB family redox-sensing transcriptional regulator
MARTGEKWRAYAACYHRNTETFFPETEREARAAKQICDRCLVQGPCRDIALRHPRLRGVWGGLTEQERDRLRDRARRRAAAG